MVTIKTQQILTASVLGTKAYNEGKKCVPAYDIDLMLMFVHRKVGETPEGEASTSDLLEAWLDNWHLANANEQEKAYDDMLGEGWE